MIERAVSREGLRRLALLRESREWRSARKPPPLGPDGERDPVLWADRNRALRAAQRRFGLTESAFKSYAQECRKRSGWMCDHIDSQVAGEHGAAVWGRFENHLFGNGRLPRVPSPHRLRSLRGRPRDRGTTDTDGAVVRPAKWQSITVRGSYWAGRFNRNGHRRPRSWETFDGGLVMVWASNQQQARELVVPVETTWPKRARRLGANAARAAYYLGDPSKFRQCRIVRRRRRGKVSYELHLLVELPPYRGARYTDAPEANVGLDMGVSTAAAVGICSNGTLAGATLVRLSPEEAAIAKTDLQRKRRLQRKLDRSLRATNPDAFDPDRKGRPGRGSYRTGSPLHRSANYRKVRAELTDLARRRSETRARAADRVARDIITTLGRHVVCEDTVKRTWQRRWGRRITLFTPAAVEAAIAREARVAGGSFTKVPCRLGLTRTCHCGAVRSKQLNERQHDCLECEPVPVDRDLHAAYMAAFVTRTADRFLADTGRALAAWPGAEQLLSAVSAAPRPFNQTDVATPRTSLPVARMEVERGSQTTVPGTTPTGAADLEHDVHRASHAACGGGAREGDRYRDGNLRVQHPGRPAR